MQGNFKTLHVIGLWWKGQEEEQEMQCDYKQWQGLMGLSPGSAVI